MNAYNPNTQKAEASGGQQELHGEFKATLQSLMLKKNPLTQSRHTLIYFLVTLIMYRWFILIKDEWEAYSVRRRLEIQYNH